MTLKEAAKLFRSLKYYEKLNREIPTKKSRLVCLIQQYEIKCLNGYEIELDGDRILYRKLPTESYRQLDLDL
ncbi:hypothetical protein HYR54_07475 [Candidatus Acetothermia bacterium]|nr:hypothetical protein [Candidatus Acetothermia bacterium]